MSAGRGVKRVWDESTDVHTNGVASDVDSTELSSSGISSPASSVASANVHVNWGATLLAAGGNVATKDLFSLDSIRSTLIRQVRKPQVISLAI